MVNPLVCAITPISYEHTEKLGNTLREIATEKAGIVKIQNPKFKFQNLIVISAPQEKEVQQIIRTRCKEVSAKLYEVGKDITYQKTKQGFNVKGISKEYKNLKIRLLGTHQIINASVAIGIIEASRNYNINVGVDSIEKGLYNTVWPGRCEAIAKKPLVVLDGAQNIASAQALKQTIKENFKYKRLILVIGISQDKDLKGICHEFYDLADEVILTKANNIRATEPKVLAKYFKGKEAHITNNVKEAKVKAQDAADQKDLILVTGSLFVVGEMRELF